MKQKMIKLKLTEADLIRAIGDYLQVQRNLGKLMYIRNNTGAIPIPAGEHKRRFVRFGDKGSPDFLVWKGGEHIQRNFDDDCTVII